MEKSGRFLHGTTTPGSATDSRSEGFRALVTEYIVEASGSFAENNGKGAVLDIRNRALKGIFGTAPFMGGLAVGSEG